MDLFLYLDLPKLYKLSSNIALWSALSFYLGVVLNLIVLFFYPFEMGNEFLSKQRTYTCTYCTCTYCTCTYCTCTYCTCTYSNNCMYNNYMYNVLIMTF